MNSFIADLYDLFERTVTIEPFVSQTAAGLPSFGAPVSYPARILMKAVGVRTIEGTIIVGRGTIYLPVADVVITTRDRITLPSDMPSPRTPPILSVSEVDDEFGGCYTVLIIG
jgi:hypothetical protein